MDIKFEPYKKSDKSYLWDTYVKAMKPHIEKMWGWDLEWQKNDFEKNLIEYQTLILNVSSERIGYLQLKYDLEVTFISMIILEPQYQSKGFGPRILEMVQSFQPKMPLTLRCFQVNQPAYNFYVRCGFEVMDTNDYFISMQRNVF